jgi:hypothetical protein
MPTIRGLSQGGVQPHASTHMSGGSDPIKLDELAAPTDVTTLNVSTTAHGLTPKLPNDATKYLDGTGAYSVPAGTSGAGRYLGTTVKTSGTSFTTGASTNTIVVRLNGGGGAGGGAAAPGNNNTTCGGGGGSGGYAEKTFSVSPSTAYTYAIGAAGAGASGAAGGAGGNSTFTVGGTTVTAKGGGGGPVKAAVGGLGLLAGGAAAAVSTSGDLNCSGMRGLNGIQMDGTANIACGGDGGSCLFGSGGIGKMNGAGAGAAGIGFGAGGGGACSVSNQAAQTGGAGLAGVIIIDEYS